MNKLSYLILAISLSFSFWGTSYSKNIDSPKVAAVVHMANNAAAVDWAAKQGANGVEMDINFLPRGIISEFKHGGVCDCSFKCPVVNMCSSTSICRVLWDATGSNCNASETPEKMMAAIGRNGNALAVVYIDSKLSNLGTDPTNLEPAGQNVIKLLDTAFAAGFKGQVLINCPEIKYSAYLTSAIKAANNSPYKDKYFFTIDGEESNFSATMQTLVNSTPNRVYSTGITADVPTRFYTVIQLAAMNLQNGSLSGVGIWSIDKDTSINDYIKLGANMILTNELPVLLSQLKTAGKVLAQPGELFLKSTSNTITGYGNSECSSNDECSNKACGRKTAADNAPLICCQSGKTDTYWGYDYCAGMPDGSICWSDGMCATGYCKNNAGGTKKGICGR